jgi:cell division protein FtsB
VTSRPRQSSAPGSGRSRAGSRPSSTTPSARTTRSTTRAVASTSSRDDPAARDGNAARSTLTGRAAILVLVLLVLAVSYASSTRAWLRQRGEIHQLNADIAAQRAQIADLEQERGRLNDPAYIGIQARFRFGWVMPGETGYRVIGDDGEVITDSSGSLSDPVSGRAAPDSDWWDTAWGSVVDAGEEAGTDAASDGGGTPQQVPGQDPAGHIGRDGHEKPETPAGGGGQAAQGGGAPGGSGGGGAAGPR